MNEQTFAELICDGHHVCSDMVNFTQKINKSHVVLDAELNIIDVAVDGELKHPVSVQK